MNFDLKRAVQCFIAEFLATAMVLFTGCMGALETSLFPNTHFQFSLNMAFMVMVAVQCFGHISGAHINPAITLAGWICGVVRCQLILVYIVAQLLGAVVGFGLLKWILCTEHGFCMTLPGVGINAGKAFAIEFVITSILVMVCCAAWDERNGKYQDSLAIRLGLTVGTLLFSAGNLSGGSMNPVRSFSPALWALDFQYQWVYWVAPLTSSLLTSVFYRYVFRPMGQHMSHQSIDIAD